jgi:hypothetical protein
MRFILFLVTSQSKGVGNGEDEDGARARAARAEVASAERGPARDFRAVSFEIMHKDTIFDMSLPAMRISKD